MTDSRSEWVQTRVTPSGLTWIDNLRKKFDISKSQVVRAAMVVASRHQEELETYLHEQAGRF